MAREPPGDDELLVAVATAVPQCAGAPSLKKVLALLAQQQPTWFVETVRARAALAVVQGGPVTAHAAVEQARARIFLRATERQPSASQGTPRSADAQSVSSNNSFDTAEEMHDALSGLGEQESPPRMSAARAYGATDLDASFPHMRTFQPLAGSDGLDGSSIAGTPGVPTEIIHVCSEGPRRCSIEELEQMYVEGTVTRQSLVQVPTTKQYISFGEFVDVYGLHDSLDDLDEAAGLAKDLHASLQGSPPPQGVPPTGESEDAPVRFVLSPASRSGSPRLECDAHNESLGSRTRQGSPSPRSVASAALDSVRQTRARQAFEQKAVVATVGVEHGDYLMMFLATGEKKHKTSRFFWVSPEKGTISWDKKKTANPRKTEPLISVQPTATTRTAREWFDKYDSGEGLNNNSLVLLYRESTGKKLGKKPLEAATKMMNARGRIGFAEFQIWWTEHGGELEKYREFALTVVAGETELLLVAPDNDAKDTWVNALTSILTSHELPWTTKAGWPSLSTNQRAAAESLGFTSSSWSSAIQAEQRLSALTAQNMVQKTSGGADLDADATHPGTNLNRVRVHRLVRTQLEAAEEARILPLKQELRSLTLHALAKRVEESGISAASLEAAMEAKDSRAACVDLLAQKDRQENGITTDVTTEWIDSLYYQFDVARTGSINGAQWSQMIGALPTWTGRSALPDGKDVKLEVITVHFGDVLPIGLSVSSGGSIEAVGEGTPAALVGITTSHFITAVNDSPITSQVAEKELESLLSSRPVVVTFSLKKWVDIVTELADAKKKAEAADVALSQATSPLTLVDKMRSAELAIALRYAEEKADRANSAVTQLHETADKLRSARWGLQLLESLGLQIVTRDKNEAENQRREFPSDALTTETRLAAARAAVASMEEEINAAQRLSKKELAPVSCYIRHLQFGIDIELLAIRKGKSINCVNTPATILLSADCRTLWVIRRDALAVDEACGRELRTDVESWQIEISNVYAVNFGPSGETSDNDKLNEVKDGAWRVLSVSSRSPDEDASRTHANAFVCRAIGDNDALAAVLGIFVAKGVDVRPGIRARLHWSSAKMRLHYRAISDGKESMATALAKLLKLSSASSPSTRTKLQQSWSSEKIPQGGGMDVSFVAWSPTDSNKRLGRAQCRAMVRLRLKTDGKCWNVSDEWIDRYFDRFDLDKSGYIDDIEWEHLAAAVVSAKQLSFAQAKSMVRVQLQANGCTVPVSDEVIEQIFGDIDTAGSGYINDDEFEQLLEALEIHHLHDILMDDRTTGKHQIKGVLNERERNGIAEYKVRYEGWSKAHDAWVDASSVDPSLVAKYRSRKGQKKALAQTTRLLQEPSVVSFYGLSGQQSRGEVAHLQDELARHKAMVQKTAELCKVEICQLQGELEQQNESHAASMSGVRLTLKQKQASHQAEMAALLTMLETAALEKALTRETVDQWKEEATSSRATLQTQMQDHRASLLESLGEMKAESTKVQEALRISHQEALEAAQQAANQREAELKTELSAHEADHFAALKRVGDAHKAHTAAAARSARDAQRDLRNRMEQQQDLHNRSMQRTLDQHASELARLNEAHADATSKAAAAHALQQESATQRARADRSHLLTELAELKGAHADMLRTTSDSFAQEKEALLGRHSAQVQHLRQSETAALEEKKRESDALQNSLRGELQELQTSHAAAVERLRLELAEHRGAHSAELRILTDSHKKQRAALMNEKDQAVACVRDEMAGQKISHVNALRQASYSHEEEKAALKTEQQEMAAAHAHALLQASRQTREVEAEFRAEIEQHRESHASALRTTSDGHAEELKAAEEAARQREMELRAEIGQHRESHASSLRTTSAGYAAELKVAEEAARQRERELHAEIEQHRLHAISEAQKAAVEARKRQETELRESLRQNGIKELRKIAAEQGVDPDAIETAQRSDNPKRDIISLIIAVKHADGFSHVF